MGARPVSALLSAALGLVLLSGCGGDDDTTAGASPATTAGSSTVPSEDPSEDSPTEGVPSLDIPTDLPSDLPTDLSGLGLDESCEAIYEALLDAAGATTDLATDPAGAGDLFGQISQSLRDAVATTDDDAIAAAAEKLAGVYDDFGAALESGETPDITDLTDASTALQEACS